MLTFLAFIPALTTLHAAQEGTQNGPSDDRLDAMERRIKQLEADRDRLNEELDAAMDVLAEAEVDGMDVASDDSLSDSTKEAWARIARQRLAPRAANVYTADGLSIGGYGEFLGQWFHDRTGDQADGLRWVMYLGNRFSDRWIFNSEIEIEHGTTGADSATTSSGGSVSIEFAYIDHLVSDNTALRGGVVLTPLGFVNERHEPTTFLPAARPQTETRIIPSTWRSMGVGAYGQAGPFAWTAYAMNGLDGSDFDANGLRGGRQKANRASIDDVALAGRIDYVGTPGLIVGLSGHTGDAGAAATVDEDLRTTIVDAHAEWNEGPFSIRALYAFATVDDTVSFNANNPGTFLSDEMRGWYVEAGYDLFSLLNGPADQSLDLFCRYEEVDTQFGDPEGAPDGVGIDDQFITGGLNYRPLNQVVIKLDRTWAEDSNDVTRFLIGYAF